ncbi:MAG: hypothetical protein ACTHVM_05495 [Alkalibacterium gilvum]|uniref:Uncharacterized protein n=1 Tax=Alkalibacterium gilvum TaxID=1130080 RepID=A0A1H6S9W3_9LACT|nr:MULTISPECIES: hypothetical protein [Alkalibacterium]MDN6193526.1 hypothetical protein [Alkalibacterium sp.]MDN6294099.1 hypothetical protein [Alkalibacterium sp.]MDN6295689.1 hypothetical protein [Alkalibacterium sp.]MDN6398180.1 hypothetical protein [Alkalibacterium sp.]MDN6729703.1 hypothetical protein [Alkalibacterium sp.]
MNIEVFTQFRLVFGLILIILGLFLILSILPKGRDAVVTFFSVLVVSITHASVAIALIITENMFLEKLSLEGDSLTFYMFLGILILAILNPIIYKLRNKSKRRGSSYSFR